MDLYGPDDRPIPASAPNRRRRFFLRCQEVWSSIPGSVKVIGAAVAFVAAALTIIVYAHEIRSWFLPKTNRPVTIINPIATSADTIRGTKFTHEQLEENFPFGYVVFRLADAKWIYEPDQSLLEKHIDWAKVAITPDFSKKTVDWYIPHLNLTWTRFNIRLANIGASVTTPMTIGRFHYFEPVRFGGVNQGEPAMCLGTLSDNQLHPVFVLGFRIPSQKGPSAK